MKKQNITTNRLKKLAGLKPLYENRKKQQLNEFWFTLAGAVAWWLFKRIRAYYDGPEMVRPGDTGGLPLGISPMEAEVLMAWGANGDQNTPNDEVGAIAKKYMHLTPYAQSKGSDIDRSSDMGSRDVYQEALDYDDMPNLITPKHHQLISEQQIHDFDRFDDIGGLPWEKDPWVLDNPFGNPWGASTGGGEGSGEGECKSGCGNLCSVATNAEELKRHMSKFGSEEELKKWFMTTIEPIGSGLTWDYVVKKAGMREGYGPLNESWLALLVGVIALGVGIWNLFDKPNCDCPCPGSTGGGMVRPDTGDKLPATKGQMNEQIGLDDTTEPSCDQWGNFQNWSTAFEENFTSAPWANNPNQPCKFFGNRIAKWEHKLAGTNNTAWQAQLNCKIDHVKGQLAQDYGCTNILEGRNSLSKVKKAILSLMKESTKNKFRKITKNAGLREEDDRKQGGEEGCESADLSKLKSQIAQAKKDGIDVDSGFGGGDSGPKEPRGQDMAEGQTNERLTDIFKSGGCCYCNGRFMPCFECDDDLFPWDDILSVDPGAGGGDTGPKEPKGQDMAESKVPRRLLEAVKAVRRANNKKGCGCSKK